MDVWVALAVALPHRGLLCRAAYRWKKRKEECQKQGNCEMGGFTRLLHSGQSDDLMDELPTVVVDPLPQSMVEHSWYVVLNRPYAFVQWTQRVKIPEPYVLMSEPDHIYLRPMPNFMKGNAPGASGRGAWGWGCQDGMLLAVAGFQRTDLCYRRCTCSCLL